MTTSLQRATRAMMAAFLLLSAACADSPELTLDDAVARVTAVGIRDHVGVLAHDSMRGRDTDDVGFEMARDYVAAEFRRIGLRPAVGDSFLQPFDLFELVGDRGSTMTVGGEVFEFPDVMLTPDWTGDTPSTTAEGVYVGHALVTGGQDGEEAVDLTGKIAFVLAGVLQGREDEPDIAMRERAEVELAQRVGAVAVVVLNPNGGNAGWVARANPRRPLRALADGSTPSLRPTANLGPDASRRLLERWASESGARAVGTVHLEPRHEIRTIRSWNVIGVLPATAPSATDETVIFTAHLDHVGIGGPDASGDSIYNGTHDNALGVAKVLAVAEAMEGARLPRSIVFMATGAEESGLLGAWYYVKHPVVPLERTAAAINHDGGLVNVHTDDVFAWGPEFSTIEADVERAAAESGLFLNPDKRPPFAPSAGLLYRSDHYPFLISGVPVVYLMPGFTIDGDGDAGRRAWEDYLATVHHVQADNFDPRAAYASPLALTAMSIRLAWRLATADGMPETHADAPIAHRRGPPTGFFFGER